LTLNKANQSLEASFGFLIIRVALFDCDILTL
jgi:hypothetical protein